MLKDCVHELDSAGTQKHDNEMATFVIGLADVTTINIFGEALKTAVHAFLRMRNVELNPCCQFVHQSVPAVLAATKGKMERDKFRKKNLQEMQPWKSNVRDSTSYSKM